MYNNKPKKTLYSIYIENIIQKTSIDKLFLNIKEFSKIKAWEWLGDTDIFGIKFEELDEIIFCCVLGNAGETFGISLYFGVEELITYFELLNGNYDFPEEALHINKTTTIYFNNRNELRNEEYNLIRLSGVKFRGKNQWPSIRIFNPGFKPKSLNIDDYELIQTLIKLFEVLPDTTLYLKENYHKASLMEEGKCYVREYSKSFNYVEKIISYDDIFFNANNLIEIPIFYDELQLKRIIKNVK